MARSQFNLRTAALVLGVVVLTACVSAPTDSNPIESQWAKAYAETSCDDWLDAMDPSQRTTMAAYYLQVFSGHKAQAIPIEVATFEAGITDYCHRPLDNLVAGLGDRAKLIEIAAGFTYQRLDSPAPPSP